MGNSSSHPITPETANKVVFGTTNSKEMSPLDTLQLISNLESQINSVVQASNIQLVKLDNGMPVAQHDQQLRENKVIRKLDEDISNTLQQLQILNVRRHIHRDIFTTYTSNHYIARDPAPFSETYLVDRDVQKRPRLPPLHKAVQHTVGRFEPDARARVQTRKVISGGPYLYEPDIACLDEPPLQPRDLQHASVVAGTKQKLPPPQTNATYAQVYNLQPPVRATHETPSESGSSGSSEGDHASDLFSSADDTVTESGYSEPNPNVVVDEAKPKPKEAEKEAEPEADQKQQFKNLLSYLAPPTNEVGTPCSPYTESMYSEISAPDSIADMTKFPDYHSHYSSHYTPSGFHVVMNQNDAISERIEEESEVSDVDTIKGELSTPTLSDSEASAPVEEAPRAETPVSNRTMSPVPESPEREAKECLITDSIPRKVQIDPAALPISVPIPVPVPALTRVAQSPKVKVASPMPPPPVKKGGKFRWGFGLFSSAPKTKPAKGKHVVARTPVVGQASVQRKVSVQRAASVRSNTSQQSGSGRRVVSGQRKVSAQRAGSVRRTGSVKPTHKRTTSSPVSVSSFDFNDANARRKASMSRRVTTNARHRHQPGAHTASRPYKGSVYPMQTQPQAGPESEYRMYSSRSGTLRKKLSDMSIASKLKDTEANEVLQSQGIPPKVPSHSVTLKRSTTSCTSASEVCITKVAPSSDTSAAPSSNHSSNPSTATDSSAGDTALYGAHDTQIYTRKCTFKRKKEQKEIAGLKTPQIVDTNTVGQAKSESGSVVSTDVSSSSSSEVGAPVSATPMLGNKRFMLAGYEDSTKLKVMNRNGDSAVTSAASSVFEQPVKADESEIMASTAHEFHSKNQLLSPAMNHQKNKLSVSSNISTGTTGTVQLQSKTNDSLARARKYFSWTQPPTNPLPGARICPSPHFKSSIADRRHSVIIPSAAESIEVSKNTSDQLPTGKRNGSGYFFGLDILGTMDEAQVTTTTAHSEAPTESPTIRVVQSAHDSDNEDEYEDIEDEEGDLFSALQKRRSVHCLDAASQANLLWATRGASYGK